jgi:signal peptidase I
VKLLKISLWVVGIFAAICLILYLTVFDVWRVPADEPMMSASVEPALTAGDLVLVARHSSPDRGNLVRCPDPQAPGRFVVGRVLGLPGEKVTIVGELVNLDGKRTPSPRACPSVTLTHPASGAEETLTCAEEEISQMTFRSLRAHKRPEPPTAAVTVDPKRVFLVSDNRHMHVDSRDYGQVDIATCQHVVFRLWSAIGFGDAEHRFSIIW